MEKAKRNWRVLILFVALLLTAPALLAPRGSREIFTSKGPGKVTKVNLNTATVKELERVPGIGHDLAQRIVDYRETHGPFHRVGDLLHVEGITREEFNRIRPYITIKPIGGNNPNAGSVR